jgi:uncharacterized protein YfiM (DUF2279 family)
MNPATMLLLTFVWAADPQPVLPSTGAAPGVTAVAAVVARGPVRAAAASAVVAAVAPSPAVAVRIAGRVPPEDPWFAEDKLRHFFISLAATNMSYGGARLASLERRPALITAGAVAGAAGLLKELRDRRRGGSFSLKDLAWDAAGIALGMAVVAQVR